MIVDGSAYIAALFDDEYNEQALALQLAVRNGQQTALVTQIFIYEVCNAIMMAFRRKRFDWNIATQHLQDAQTFPAQTELMQPVSEVVALSHKHGLTIYDASYLELAKRKKLPLATLDKALISVAASEHVELFF